MRTYIISAIILLISCTETSHEPNNLEVDKIYLISVQELLALKPKTIKINTHTKQQRVITTFQAEQKQIGKYLVMAPISGFLKSVKVYQGQNVNKGDLLAVLSHPDYLDLKIAYLHAKSELEYQKKHFARQGELAIEMATSIKKMEMAERDYKQAEIEFKGLAEKLKLLGIDETVLNADKLSSKGYVYSPISGNVSKIGATRGQYCSNEHSILTISTGTECYITTTLQNTGPNNFGKIKSIEILLGKGDTLEVKDYEILKQDNDLYLGAIIPQEYKVSNHTLKGMITKNIPYNEIPKSSLVDKDKLIFLNKLNGSIILKQAYITEIKQENIECLPVTVPDGYELLIGKTDSIYQILIKTNIVN